MNTKDQSTRGKGSDIHLRPRNLFTVTRRQCVGLHQQRLFEISVILENFQNRPGRIANSEPLPIRDEVEAVGDKWVFKQMKVRVE